MRIGYNYHCADTALSGVEYYSLDLLRGLLDIDRHNWYIVFTNRPNLVESHIGMKDNLIIRDCSFLKNRLYRIIWEHSRLAGVARQEKLDVLHCPHYICPAFGTSTAYVATIHDTIAIDYPYWCKRTNAAYYGRFLGRSVQTASKIAAVSKFTADRIKDNFNTNGSKVAVIHPGVDSDVFNPYRDRDREKRVRMKYHLPEHYILYSGNIEPKKNILNLLKAFGLLKKYGIQHHLVITGGKIWKSKNIYDYVNSAFVPNEVLFTGYIQRRDLGTVYQMSDCLVVPSYCEGFCFPGPEGFACGVPVAASCVGILQETDPDAYTVLEPDHPAQMAEAIRRLLTDNTVRDTQVQAAFREAQKYDWSVCAAQTLALYREACTHYE